VRDGGRDSSSEKESRIILATSSSTSNAFTHRMPNNRMHRPANEALELFTSHSNIFNNIRIGLARLTDPFRVAEHEKADLIVIASHGATGWNRFVLGSVAEKVVHLASCAVLMLRAHHETAKDAASAR
jgi:hypothetical protein